MPMRIALVATALLAAGCHLFSGDPPPANAPGAPVSKELPPELAAALPKTTAGLPKLHEARAEGFTLQLGYDANLDDPITRWAGCMGRVVDCVRANPNGPFGGCVPQISVCPSDEGGDDCCPKACLDEFKEAYRRTQNDRRAVEESILTGRCIPGFAEQVQP